jgi:hypothetical protein
MLNSGAKSKLGSIFIIVILILSGILIILPLTMITSPGNAATTWTDTSNTDFNKGQFNNVEIEGTGSAAELKLKGNFGGNWTEKPRGSLPESRRGHSIASIHGTDKVLLFGGFKDGKFYDDTWVYDLSENKWTDMKPSGKPGGRHSHAMAAIYGDDKVVLFGGYKSSSASNNETWVYDLNVNTWTQKSPSTKPATRAYHTLSTVHNDDKIILFSGYNKNLDTYLNDTWEYDLGSNSWINKSPSNAPSPRKGHEMANINGTKRFVLFGGNELGTKLVDDTWIYNLTANTWTKKTLSTKPSSRRGHGMAAISGTKKVMIFGPDDQTWVYDVTINTWTKKSPITKPNGRYITHAIAGIYGDDKAVMFSGAYGSGSFVHLDDTWVYDLGDNTWSNKTLVRLKPGIRRGHVLATIHGTDRVLLFGGWNGGYLGDTWVYDLSNDTWTEMKPATKPSARHSHAMAMINGKNKVLLFGGYDSGGTSGETWVYDLNSNTWTKKSPVTKPSGREYHAMASVYDDDKVVLFGGYINSSGYKNDTWIYDLSNNTWTKRTPSTAPSPRKGHEMANVWNTKKIVLFGGNESGNNVIDDTWVYDVTANTWTKKSLSTKPSSRRGHGIAAIHGTDIVMIFGSDDETWIYDLGDNKWNKQSPITKPSARYITHGITPVHGTGKAVLFGGGTSGGDLDDTWIYNAGKFLMNGSYLSSAYDSGANSSFISLKWTSNTPAGTNIKFQLRTAATQSALTSKSFVGSGGVTANYYTSSPSKIWSGHKGDRWIQYKAYLTTNSGSKTPVLKDVTISYNNLKKPKLLSPINNAVISSNQPTFIWENSHLNEEYQTAFQLIISDDISFTSFDFDSGEQVSEVSSWEFPTSTNYEIIPDGTWYWKVKIKDNYDYWGIYSDPVGFTVDSMIPKSIIIEPVENRFYSGLNSISGTASDSQYGTGVENVEIRVKRLSDNYYWEGSDWSNEKNWLLVIGTNPWSFDTSDISWSSGVKYNIKSRAIDIAGNYEVQEKGIDFDIDFDLPISSIKSPKNNEWVNNQFLIEGSATDVGGSGIKKVEISVEAINEDLFWNGKSWGSSEYWLSVSGTESWSFEPGNIDWYMDTPYLMRSRATDVTGNLELAKEGNTFMIDNEPPGCSIIINNGDKYTNSPLATLTIYAEDHDSGVSQMSFGMDGVIWSDWEKFNTVKSYNLPDGDGEQIVYLSVQDYAGNIPEPALDSIILDTVSPQSLSVSINNNAAVTESQSVILSLGAVDSGSNVVLMSFSTDGDTWSAWETFTESKEFDLPIDDGDGKKTIYFKVKDGAGNVAEPVIASILLDTYNSLDSDNDGYPDNLDAFPLDPAAAVDTDGDKYPDYWNPGMTENNSTTGLKIDEVPNDPKIHIKPKDKNQQNTNIFVIIVIIFIIIVMTLLASIIVKNKSNRKKRQSGEDEIINSIKNEILQGKEVDDTNLSKTQLKSLLNENYPPGELSENTNEFIENLIDDSD